MELIYELTHNMFEDIYIFSFTSAGQRDFLTLDNPIKEINNWKSVKLWN